MRALFFFYIQENRYSLNALLGAVEDLLSERTDTAIYFFKNGKDLIQGVESFGSDFQEIIILISLHTPQFWTVKSLIAELRSLKIRAKLTLIGGGPHASALPKNTLDLGFDFVFVGEAEESFRAFLESYRNGNEALPLIKGLACYIDGNYFFSGKAKPVDLKRFAPFSLRFGKISPIEITRGCPFVCKYCQTPRLFGTKIRHRSIEDILFYAEALLKRGIRDLRFITPNAFSYGSEDGKTLNVEALRTLLRELYLLSRIYGGRIYFGSFPSEVRPEHVTEETITLVKTFCHNDNLVIGAQTGSEPMLTYIRRDHSLEDVRKAVDLTLKAGLKIKVDFIFGLPEETEEDVKATLSFMEELAKKGAIIHAHTFMPLPQTPFMRKPAGRISPEVFHFIRRFLPKGQIFGHWQKQMELAKRIEREILGELS
ncbi:MAG: TIGR04013 family B12-binding domain/radical SAM domain-containing protein [Caldimicrobium sp.]|nr:TIGR04013 family B12-binding domain/radical SAM domain-containing protein [Caldimicrobium sp.]MCX7613782.1 TIGR04013 family B12-binding domain/radical SAM domain-containing protein [Caldimicrobium sp.]MDW8182609.1 TIGR04013 family B12-binding domain/radical SAM domain-containing protein [Caldimicrobium sp.]